MVCEELKKLQQAQFKVVDNFTYTNPDYDPEDESNTPEDEQAALSGDSKKAMTESSKAIEEHLKTCQVCRKESD